MRLKSVLQEATADPLRQTERHMFRLEVDFYADFIEGVHEKVKGPVYDVTEDMLVTVIRALEDES